MNQIEKADYYRKMIFPIIADACDKYNFEVKKTGMIQVDFAKNPRIRQVSSANNRIYVVLEDLNGPKLTVPMDYLDFYFQNDVIYCVAYMMKRNAPLSDKLYIGDLMQRIEDNIINEGNDALFKNIVIDFANLLKKQNGNKVAGTETAGNT